MSTYNDKKDMGKKISIPIVSSWRQQPRNMIYRIWPGVLSSLILKWQNTAVATPQYLDCDTSKSLMQPWLHNSSVVKHTNFITAKNYNENNGSSSEILCKTFRSILATSCTQLWRWFFHSGLYLVAGFRFGKQHYLVLSCVLCLKLSTAISYMHIAVI